MQPIYSNNKASSNYLELMEVLITYFENMKNLKIHHLFKLLFKSFIFILSHKYANSLYQKYSFLKYSCYNHNHVSNKERASR